MALAEYLARTSPSGMTDDTAAALDVLGRAIYPEGGRAINEVDVIRSESSVADGAAIFLLDRAFVLFVAPHEHPEAAEMQRTAMVRIQQSLPQAQCRMLLPITASGYLAERSFIVLPRCNPLASGRIGRLFEKRRVADEILPWLRELAVWNVRETSDPQRFIESMQALIRMEDLPGDLLDTAQRIEQGLRATRIRPWHIPMHGDLWRNNIMRREDGSLAVIDWAGSEVDGYGIYDLVRFKQSLNISRASYCHELRWYTEALGGEDGVITHLLGALGHYGDRLGEFPRERFVTLASECYALLMSGLSLGRGGVAHA